MPSNAFNLGKLLTPGTSKIGSENLGDDVSTIEQASSINNLSASGNAVGDQRVIGNNLYIWNGSGWFRIALINATPTFDSGGQPEASYVLDADSPQSPTVITMGASDPDGFPITFSFVTGGSMDSIATISQDSSVFTITPKTLAQVGAGTHTGTITFKASDGVNILPHVSSFTLIFVSTVINSRYTVSLINAASTGNNNNITDSSSSNHTITANNRQAGTFSPYRHAGYSTRVTGNDRLEASGFTISGSWTFEFWYKLPTGVSLDNYQTIASFGQSNGTNCRLFRMMQDPSTKFAFDFSGGGGAQNFYTHTATYNQDQWYHICATYDATANTEKVYIDGTEVYSVSFTTNYTGVTTAMIGQERTDSSTLAGTPKGKGIFRDFHVIGNAAVAPAAGGSKKVELQSGSVLLLFSGGALIDTSTSNCTISVGSNIDNFNILVDTPYDNIQYDSTAHGGSVYFDGSDHISIADSTDFTVGSNSFTAECWVYPTASPSQPLIFGQWSNPYSWAIQFSANSNRNLRLLFHTGSISDNNSTAAIALNQWSHVALVKSGTSVKGYINGSEVLTATVGTLTDSSSAITVGGQTGNGQPFTGNITEARLVIGTAVYSGEFTPPSGPLTTTGGTYPSTTNVNTSITSSHTKLLIPFTDASIIDESQISSFIDLIHVDNNNQNVEPAGSTTQVKFAGTKSMHFDQDVAIVKPTNVNDYILGTGDFTIEKWIYFTGYDGGDNLLYDFRPSGVQGAYLVLYENNGTLKVYVGSPYNGNTIVAGSALSLNTWYHIALCRSGTSKKLFIDGTQSGSTYNDNYNISYTCADRGIVLGSIAYNNSYSAYGINAYMQDFRITKGLARYTSNFTPPTEPLKG